MDPKDIAPWGLDWAWGLPLIALTVMFHVSGLGLLKRLSDRFRQPLQRYPGSSVAAAALFLSVLHGLEATLWAGAFVWLSALPDLRSGELYSLNAITAFGHTDLTLERKWQLMGSLESLNGWILFGLSAAFLFTLVQNVWSHREQPSGSSARIASGA
jgi:hypothetical protein